MEAQGLHFGENNHHLLQSLRLSGLFEINNIEVLCSSFDIEDSLLSAEECQIIVSGCFWSPPTTSPENVLPNLTFIEQHDPEDLRSEVLARVIEADEVDVAAELEEGEGKMVVEEGTTSQRTVSCCFRWVIFLWWLTLSL